MAYLFENLSNVGFRYFPTLKSILTFILMFMFYPNMIRAESSTIIEISNELQVLYVNKIAFDDTERKSFEVTTGEHEFVVRFVHKTYKARTVTTFKSEPIVLTLSINDLHRRLYLSPQLPKSKKEQSIRAFVKKPKLQLIDQFQKAIHFNFFVLPIKPGLQFNRDYLAEIDNFQQSGKTHDWRDNQKNSQLTCQMKK